MRLTRWRNAPPTVYDSRTADEATASRDMTAKRTLTATLADGTTVTRKTERTYTHVVIHDEISMISGNLYRANINWAGSLQKAQAVAAGHQRHSDKYGTKATIQIVPV